jgi:hypothetical protein
MTTSERNGMHTSYHSIAFNCANEMIRNLDRNVDYSLREKFAALFTALTSTVAPCVRNSLEARGLLFPRGEGELPLLGSVPSVAHIIADLRSKR